MSRSIKFNIETQTENKEIILICHLSEKAISLESSEVARKIFSNNRPLFDRINLSTKILNGKVYRQETIKSNTSLNRLAVKTNMNHNFLETEISNFTFSSDALRKQRRIMDKSNRLFDFDPKTLKVNKFANAFDPQNLTPDDIKNSMVISEVEELLLFQNQSVRTFMIKDFLEDKKDIYEVSYRIEFNTDTKFKEYLDFVVKELDESIKFLNSYSKSLQLPSRYDSVNSVFVETYVDSVYESLGILDETRVNLGSSRIKSSEFGRAALAFYNASLMLTENVEKSIYGKIMRAVLPSSLTSPELVKSSISSFSNLYNLLTQEYGVSTGKDKKNRKQKIHSSKKVKQKYVNASTETIRLDQEALGYNVFTENQSGLNTMSANTYKNRFIEEQMKYYPSLDINDESSFMTKTEKKNFASLKNAPAFLTPSNLVMGKKRITTSRGLANINIDDVREFRISKSSAAASMSRTRFPTPSKKASLSKDVMSEFNLTIGPPKKALLTRATEENIDPLVDAKHYVGFGSFFVTDNPASILRTFKNIKNKEDKKIFAIVSDVIPGRFLRRTNSIESIKDLQISNKKSKFRGLVAERSIELSEIPPQIKSMMSSKFQTNPDIDPLQNKETRAIIDETQKNVFLIKAHVGFEKGKDGFADLNMPIIIDMNDSSLDGKPVLAKAYNYEVPQLGIVKDKFMPTIYNNLLYIRN